MSGTNPELAYGAQGGRIYDAEQIRTVRWQRSNCSQNGSAIRVLEPSPSSSPIHILFPGLGNYYVPPAVPKLFGKKVDKSNLKPIFLREMPASVDKVYENRMLVLTLIDNPMFGYPSINLLAKDEEGKFTRFCIYNLPQNKAIANKLSFGTTWGIIDPYHRIARYDETHGIRVDDPENRMIEFGKKTKMCRYCWFEDSKYKCSKCKANYCSKECQTKDWKDLQHKLICKEEANN